MSCRVPGSCHSEEQSDEESGARGYHPRMLCLHFIPAQHDIGLGVLSQVTEFTIDKILWFAERLALVHQTTVGTSRNLE
jgi:hypothetical protein